MENNRWTINGRTFRTPADYEAALRDLAKIEAIRKKTDFRDKAAVDALYAVLLAGTLQFETILGRDFDDEIYELREKNKAAQAAGGVNGDKTSGRRKTAERREKAAGRKAKAAVKTRQAQRQRAAVRKPLSLEQYDEEMKREIVRQLRKQEKRRKIIVTCCALVAAGSLGYFFVYNYFAARTQSSTEQLAQLREKGNFLNLPGTVHRTGDEETLDILDEYKLLYNKNKSLIGWLKIADTKIDYPVMKPRSENRDYYLEHNFEQEKDRNGSIFMDPLCDVLKPSTNLIVYGHHMKSGNMFGGLDKYSSMDYYREHKTIQFDTIYEKGTYEVMFVFRSRIFYEDEITFKYYQFIDALSEAEFNSAMEAMAEMTLYDTGVTARYGDELLTLSTCDSSEEDGRFVVVAKRVS